MFCQLRNLAALHYLILSMQQRGSDLNTASYQIISQAKRNSLPMYFVSQCQRKTTAGFFQSSLNSQTLSCIYWMNKLPEIKLFLQKDVYNRTVSKSDWGNSDIDKRKIQCITMYCYTFPKWFFIMDIVAKCFQNSALKPHRINTLMVQNT